MLPLPKRRMGDFSNPSATADGRSLSLLISQHLDKFSKFVFLRPCRLSAVFHVGCRIASPSATADGERLNLLLQRKSIPQILPTTPTLKLFFKISFRRQSDPLLRRRSNPFHSRNCGLSNAESFHHSGI